MVEPSPRSSRLVFAGAVAAALAVGGAGFLLGRGTAEGPQVVVAQKTVPPVAVPTPEPLQIGMLGRSDLIALAAAAADAAAAGHDPGQEITEADGRRFELRLPFGCDGPAKENGNAAMQWRYNAEDQALRIHVDPVMWTAQDWGEGGADGIEAVEGFWITRPWTSSEACPSGGGQPAELDPEPVTPPGQTLALGQIFSAHGARTGRRNGEPYQSTVRIPEDELDTTQGFRLRISGRLVRTGAIGPVHCRRAANPEQRPSCLINVVTDEIAIENPASRKTIATWSPDR